MSFSNNIDLSKKRINGRSKETYFEKDYFQENKTTRKESLLEINVSSYDPTVTNKQRKTPSVTGLGFMSNSVTELTHWTLVSGEIKTTTRATKTNKSFRNRSLLDYRPKIMGSRNTLLQY